MTAFWKSMAQVAQGQLFIGGHLSPAVVCDLARRASGDNGTRKHSEKCRDHLPWPRLAIPH